MQKNLGRCTLWNREYRVNITGKQAAGLLGLSERQIKRLKAGVKGKGLAVLAHGNRDRKPKHAIADDERGNIVEFATGKYHDATYPHMSELLAEKDKIRVSAKTIARIFKGAGISHRHTRKAARRKHSRNGTQTNYNYRVQWRRFPLHIQPIRHLTCQMS